MSIVSAAVPLPDSREGIVRRYVAAFNAHDVEAMLSMVTDNVQWLSVNGDMITIETNNKEELHESMVSYFHSDTVCKTHLTHVFSTGTRVSALEVASAGTADGIQEQQSLSVYEFNGLLIERVYYFPVEKLP